jgi:flagellar protein FlaG
MSISAAASAPLSAAMPQQAEAIAPAGVPNTIPQAAVDKAPAGNAGREALPKDMTTAVSELRDALRTTPFGLQFEIDDVTHKVITKVVDRETGEVIRQLPSEEMVRIAHAMNKLQGLLVRQSA